MSQKSDADYLRDMLLELDDIADFTKDGKAVFMDDSKTRKAVIRSYEVIGEIVKRLSEAVRNEHSEIKWRQLAGFRDFLAHHYEEVILDRIWDAVEDLADLQSKIELVLDAVDSDKNV